MSNDMSQLSLGQPPRRKQMAPFAEKIPISFSPAVICQPPLITQQEF